MEMKISQKIIDLLCFTVILFSHEISSSNPLEKNKAEISPASLIDSVNSLKVMDIYVESFLPNEDDREYITEVAEFYILKSELEAMDKNGTTDIDSDAHESVKQIVDLVINQTCIWLISIISEDDFKCTANEVIWLDKKLKLIKLIEEMTKSLQKTSEETIFNICEWMNKYIHCNDRFDNLSLKTFAMNYYSHCKPPNSCS